MDWCEFRSTLLKRYNIATVDAACQDFLDIRQRGTILDYRTEFESFAAYLPHILEYILIQTYMKGLKPNIQAELDGKEVQGLCEVMDASIQAETRLQTFKEWLVGLAPSSHTMTSRTTVSGYQSKKTSTPTPTVISKDKGLLPTPPRHQPLMLPAPRHPAASRPPRRRLTLTEAELQCQ